MIGSPKRLINNVPHEKTWTWLIKVKIKKETEPLLIARENNAIRTNQFKVRIDKTQQNSKYKFCGVRDETINHIISECSKLAQKGYKTRHDWVGKVIHWEVRMKFKFNLANKWYIHNPVAVLENDTYILLWDFDIQTYHLISPRKSDLTVIKKMENLENCRFCCPASRQNKTEIMRKNDKYLDFSREVKNRLNMKVTILPIRIGALLQ